MALVSNETFLDRLEQLIDEAVRAGRFTSPTDFILKAGLTSGYLGEFRTKRPKGGVQASTAKEFARMLGISVASLLDPSSDEEPPVVDIYPGRAWAIGAARNLQLPEAAIQLVLKEDPGADLGRMYWFRRIESEAERVAPASQG